MSSGSSSVQSGGWIRTSSCQPRDVAQRSAGAGSSRMPRSARPERTSSATALEVSTTSSATRPSAEVTKPAMDGDPTSRACPLTAQTRRISSWPIERRRSTSARTRRATATTSCPSRVRRTPRPLRSKTVTPISASSPRTARLSAGWATCSSSGGPGHRAFVGRRDEVAELLQVHGERPACLVGSVCRHGLERSQAYAVTLQCQVTESGMQIVGTTSMSAGPAPPTTARFRWREELYEIATDHGRAWSVGVDEPATGPPRTAPWTSAVDAPTASVDVGAAVSPCGAARPPGGAGVPGRPPPSTSGSAACRRSPRCAARRS